MTTDIVLQALQVSPFVFATTFTPGPNNFLVLSSGVNFGVVRTLPHMLGIMFGFPVMILAVALGLAPILERSVALHLALHLFGLAYLFLLAWRIANAGAPVLGGGRSEPMTFLQAAAFQWINPKAWILALGAMSAFTTVGGDLALEIGVVAAVFAAMSLPCSLLWAVMGDMVGRLLRSPRLLRTFNIVMAILVVLSVLPTAVVSIRDLLQGHAPVPTTAAPAG